MKYRKNLTYYFTNYKEIEEYINEFVHIIKNTKIKAFIPSSGISYTTSRSFTDKLYDTDEENYLIFEDNTVLKFDYNDFSLIHIKLTEIGNLPTGEIEMLKKSQSFDFDCYGEYIVDYEINKFTDEYIIEPSEDITRPAGGEYFKEIIFHLSNHKKICICPENPITDGYCNIWMEDNNKKGIFNGEEHKSWYF